MVDGAVAVTSITVSGARSGDFVQCSFSSITGGGWNLYGYVSANNVVTVSIVNHTGGTVDLASGTLAVLVTGL